VKASDPAPFPWEEAMAFGLGRLRLSPQSFWAMTPRELAAAMRVWRREETRSIEHDALERLMRAFPDEGGEHE
jgi:uncharacterized phage protein (TIGR02216 family)